MEFKYGEEYRGIQSLRKIGVQQRYHRRIIYQIDLREKSTFHKLFLSGYYRRNREEGERKISYFKSIVLSFLMRNCYRYREQPALFIQIKEVTRGSSIGKKNVLSQNLI